MAAAIVSVFRSTQEGGGTYQDDPGPVYEGMVELDAVYSAPATSAPDLAVRWHGKAGTCCAAVYPEDIHSPDNAMMPVIRAETTSWYHADTEMPSHRAPYLSQPVGKHVLSTRRHALRR
jgi:hypothetical protein